MITSNGKIYGCGEGIALGINSKQDQYLPVQINMPFVKQASAGDKFTFVIDEKDCLWKFGEF